MVTTFITNKDLIMESPEAKTKDIFTRKNLYNATEVARITGFSVSTIIQDLNSNRLKHLVRGKTKYITSESLQNYLTKD